ncbi:hypothetical protein H8A97_12920 [Bradyrhizobium sp. Arg62]|uniref:hypothetical protein n=1 Tax=Bradyrhizobium brasilense TaxID=1419277 RepID=UPI001E618F6E|nr:hypothetical protein [Bradyrhizobium brasilense]MCC8945975.1 hypothetical protein [Bradyrhizobium brasilense]
MPEGNEPTFAEIAVALTLLKIKAGMDVEKTKIIAERIGLSKMGYELIIPDLERDLQLVECAMELFREMAAIEPQIRAAIARKNVGSWLSRFPKVAAL